MKKLLILGANNSQVQIIQAAKEEGYYVIVCDYTNDNPGIPLVDKHYQVSYQDQERVLSIARQEHIDGIIGNTDPAMPVVAYLSEQLGLVGNKQDSIRKLISKTEFRKLQERVGLYRPKHIESDECTQAEANLERFKYPIIVKPSIYSASRGITKIYKNQTERFRQAFQSCKELSLNGKVTIEEYVEMPSMETIEGDIFVMGDEILWNGLFTTCRSVMAPMIPMTYIFPAVLSQDELSIIKAKLTKVFKEAGVRYGEYNVEMYFTTEGELFVIEINPRQGGHRITQMIRQHTGIDFNKLLVTTAVGCNGYYDSIRQVNEARNFLTHHVIFSNFSGILEGIKQNPVITKYITNVEFPKAFGTTICQRDNGSDYIAYATLQFPDRDTQLSYSGEQIERLIYPVLKNKQYPIADCTLPYQLIYDFMTGDAHDFFVPKLQKANRTPEDYAEQFSAYCTIVYDLDEQNRITGMVAGYTHNLRIPEWSYIAEAYVNGDQRHKGLGEKLLVRYIEYCKSIGMKGVWLNVREENLSAQRLYKKIGFVFDETYSDNGYLKMDLRFQLAFKQPMQSSLVSILVPVYNVEPFIERCARSIFEQTYDNLECVFIDDGSADNSIAIVKRVLSDYPKRKKHTYIIHHSHNRGLAAARNTALRACHGDYVIHVDSDDWIETTAVESLLKRQQETGADIVYTTGYYKHLKSGIQQVLCLKWSSDKNSILTNMLQDKATICMWSKLIKKSLYTDNGITCDERGSFYEDFQVLTRLLYYSKTISCLDSYIYHYNRLNPNSLAFNLSRNIDIQKQGLQSIVVVCNFFKDKEEQYHVLAQQFYRDYIQKMLDAHCRHGNKNGYNEFLNLICSTEFDETEKTNAPRRHPLSASSH